MIRMSPALVEKLRQECLIEIERAIQVGNMKWVESQRKRLVELNKRHPIPNASCWIKNGG